MDNSPRLPTVAVVLAAIMAVIALVSYASGTVGDVPVLSEMEIALASIALTLLIFGLQGWVSVLLEGRRLRPGLVRPRLTNPLSWGIVLCSLLLLGVAIALASGIRLGWGPMVLGSLAGAGSLLLAALLIFYKEAFIGDEAGFDERDDGVPW